MAEHFAPWVWAGFASQSLPRQEMEAILAHLDTGCAACGHEHDLWRLLRSTLQREREPVDAGCVEQAIALAGPKPRAGRGLRAPAWDEAGVHLAFDNFTAPWPATVRSSLHARRHCVYELRTNPRGAGAAAAVVEVMVERVSSHEGWSVVGQVFTAAGAGWRDCTVALARTEGAGAPPKLQRARTNAFGEFSFVQSDAGPWKLDLQAGQKRWGVNPVLLP